MRVLARHNGGGNVLHFDGGISLAKTPEHRKLSYWDPDYAEWNPGW